jgi:hypothetical protein
MLRGTVFVWAITTTTLALGAELPNAAHAIAQKFAEQSAPAKTERPPIDYEMEMLRRARAEQAAAQTAPAPTVAPPAQNATSSSVVPAAALPEAADVAPTVTPQLLPFKAAESPPAPVSPTTSAAKTEVQAKVETKPADQPRAIEPPGAPAARASLLLALETGGASSKSGTATFDPMLCISDACYVSAGFQVDAIKLAKSDALKLKSTSDASPDSCNGRVACVFRNVPVANGAQIQVVELGSASHDPTHTSDLQLDQSCKTTEGDLSCDNPIATTEFRIWVVPEETARTAGAQELEEVLADGLPHIDVARSTDK